MAMSVMYTTINGVLYHENRGGVETEYIPDTLGSLIGCRDSSGNVTYTADYWPYGEVRTSTGSKTSPWGFVGLLGYLTDIAKRLYVRARHYRPGVGQWQTVDPLWPEERAYSYSDGRPESYSDPDGMQAKLGPKEEKWINLMFSYFCESMKLHEFRKCVQDCTTSYFPMDRVMVEGVTKCMSEWCTKGRKVVYGRCPGNGCAQTEMHGGSGCTIRICERMFSPGSGCPGMKDPFAWVHIIAHELGHCCNPYDTMDILPNNVTPGGLCNIEVGKCIQQKCAPLLLNNIFSAIDQVARY